MKKKLLTLAMMCSAVLAMGITMPACPGQQAMQQQIDELKLREADLTKRLATLEGTVKASAADVTTMKTAMAPVGQQLQAIGPRLDAVEAALKEVDGKIAAATAKPAGKKKK